MNIFFKKLIILFLGQFLFFCPLAAGATASIMIMSPNYNISHDVKAGEIWHIDKLVVVNTGDENLDLNLNMLLLSVDETVLTIKPSSIEIEAGKAKNINLEVTTPFNIKPGSHRAQLTVQSQATQKNTNDNAEASTYVDFIVLKSNYAQAIWQRFISMGQQDYTTFYLLLILIVLWLGFLLVVLFNVIRGKFFKKS